MESHDSLPYIDEDVSSAQRDAANSLIRRELPQDHATTLHSSIAEALPSRLTSVQQSEVNRAGSGKPLTGGVDLARYESFDEISADVDAESLKSALRTAYANISYLDGRQSNITLLEEYGKNAWLVGNSHLDDIQKRLENELASTKEQAERTNRARKSAQEYSRGELLGLGETWKQGIGRIVETQLARDALRRQLSHGQIAAAAI